MSEDKEETNLRGSIKAPTEFVKRVRDLARVIRDERKLSADPAAWTVLREALDSWDRKTNNESGTEMPLRLTPPGAPSTSYPSPRVTALVQAVLRADQDKEGKLAGLASIAISALELYGRSSGTIGDSPRSDTGPSRVGSGKGKGSRGAKKADLASGSDPDGNNTPGGGTTLSGEDDKLA